MKSTDLITVGIDACTDSLCSFKKGNNFTVEYTFISNSDHDELYHLIFLNVSDWRLNFFGLHNTVACPFIHLKTTPQTNGCPMKKGEEYLYHIDLMFPHDIPKVENFILHWSLRDRATDEDCVCFEAHAEMI